MANKFQITISAVDKATATLRKINASMDRLTRPVKQLGSSLKGLGREAGLDKIGSDMGNLGKSARDLGGKLSALAAPLAVIVGGGTIAGVAALATEWGRLGSEIARSEATLGTTGASLQSLRGAAQAAGLSSSELTGGLKSLGDTMEDALYGRNQQALVMLNRLGLGIHHTASGSIDAARGFRDLAGSISAIKNAQVQGLVARTFGLEALLPLLRQGPQAIDAYERKVSELGGVMSDQAVRGAQDFGLQMNYLSIATQGARNAIGEKLLPILQPLVEGLTRWISQNRELIATRVADFVQGLAQWIRELDFNKIGADIRAFGHGVMDVVNALGGWKKAAIAVVIIMEGNLLASVLNLGMALGHLSVVAMPAVIRGFGLMAALLEATVVPALLKGILSSGLFTASLAESAAGIPVLGSVLAAFSKGILAVGAAIAATPVGWLVAGAAAIAAGVYVIYRNWDNIAGYFSAKFAGIKAAFDKNWVLGIVKALSEFQPIELVGDALNGLTKWLFDFDLYDAGKKIIAGLVRGLKSVVGMLPSSVLKFLGLDGWVGGAVAAPASPAAAAAPAAAAVQTSAQAGSPAARGVRNNNPGNLREWGDMPRDRDGYAVFPTAQAGLDAMIKNLRAQEQKHGLNTISGIIGKWAPSSENNTNAYVSSVASDTGFSANQKLNLDDQQTVAPLISAIIKHEGNGAGYTQDMIKAAVAAQLGGAAPSATPVQQGPQKLEVALTVAGLPSGVTLAARTADGQPLPVRTAFTMPTGLTP